MGCSRQLWMRATVKELIDNALDSSEEAGLAPEITVVVRCTAGCDTAELRAAVEAAARRALWRHVLLVLYVPPDAAP
jgi:hypothetical protein